MATVDEKSLRILTSSEQRKLVVYEYIRKKLSEKCPNDIRELCLKWYSPKRDNWDLSTKSSNIQVNEDIAEMKNTINLFSYSTIAGCDIVSKDTEFREWGIKCISYSKYYKR